MAPFRGSQARRPAGCPRSTPAPGGAEAGLSARAGGCPTSLRTPGRGSSAALPAQPSPAQPNPAQPSPGSRKLRAARWGSKCGWVRGPVKWWDLARWACFASGSALCPAERPVQAGFYVRFCDHVIILKLLGELLFHVTANWNRLALLGLQVNLLKKQIIEIIYLLENHYYSRPIY